MGQVTSDPEYIGRHYAIKAPAPTPAAEPAAEWHPARIPVQNFSENNGAAVPKTNGVAHGEEKKVNGVNGTTEVGGAVQAPGAPVVVEGKGEVVTAVKEVAAPLSEKVAAVTMVESVAVPVVN